MKLFKTLLTILFISLLSSPSWSVTLGDLVKRDGIHYEKFTDVPFTGKVTGQEQGSFKNGKKVGTWVMYFKNGQLESKGNFKNGKREGTWINYWGNGQLFYKGNFKNDKYHGSWVAFNEDGSAFKSWTGTYKDGEYISD
jgi:hypothetical protein